MKISMCLPYMKKNYRREQIVEWCRRLDAGPFHGLSCGERITGNTVEVNAMLGAAAALTERIRIVPSLYVLPMRSAVWTAKEAATLDLLSNGRVTLVVGVGGREKDYHAVGASFERRHQRMDEQVAEMKRIWAGEPPFAGADPVGPEPIQAGGPPIWIGAMGPKSMARGARWADGIYAFSLNGEAHEIDAMFKTWDSAWQAAERQGKSERVAGFWYSLAPNAEHELQNYVYEYLKIAGDQLAKDVAKTMTRHTPEAVSQAIDDMEKLGCDQLYLVPATACIEEIDGIETILQKR